MTEPRPARAAGPVPAPAVSVPGPGARAPRAAEGTRTGAPVALRRSAR